MSINQRFAEMCLMAITILMVAILSISSCLLADDYGFPAEPYHMWSFQTTDVAGFGKAVERSEDALLIDVQQFWTGGFETNPILINGAYGEWSDGVDRNDPDYYDGKFIVFFATTNMKRRALSNSPSFGTWDFDKPLAFTNSCGTCELKFVFSNPPTWYAVETNDTERLTFFSNIVNSIVVNRNRDLFYTTLRDAVKQDESGADPYKTMSHITLMELTWTSSETNLVEMVNDSLLFPKMRRHALFQLKKRFDWPATNTIPIP
jgi:hypothetical protein